VIGVSRHVLEKHAAFFPRAGLHVIPHPLTAVGSPTLAPPGRLRSLGYIGSLEVTKGVGELLLAAPELRRDGFEVHVAGDGRLRDEVAAAAAAGTVVYHGVVRGPAKEAFFAACDAGVVPSTWDEPGSPPYVVLEWLTASRPVLASSRGGLAERAAELPGLVLVEPTAATLAAAVRGLAAEPRWGSTVAAIRPADPEAELDRWVLAHEEVYAAARRGGARAA
jgi:glycosyltransferase involved in cell wall biosynthesis